MRLKKVSSLRINSDMLAMLAFVLFMCNPFLKRCFAFVLSTVGMSRYSTLCTCIVIYLPVFMLCFLSIRKIKLDFILLLVSLVCFFLLTFFLHPEYEFWYTRSYYGVWDYVLRPDNGLYAYFFVRLLNNPQKIKSALRTSGYIMIVHYGFLLITALQRGYWENTDRYGRAIQMSYDLTFGYDVSLYALFFLYAGIQEKRLRNWIFAGCYIAMIILGGSRGPLMCLAVFIAIIGFQMLSSWKKHPFIVLGGLCAFTLFIIFYDVIFAGLATFLSKLGFNSRTLTMLLSGEIMNDNGRDEIWNAAIGMIRENPFGYGAMGTRHVIYYFHEVGHPHQFLLEVLVDHGVIMGTIILVTLFACAGKILFKPMATEWQGLFIVFFCRSCQLMLSGTYWHVMPLWACIGIGVCYFEAVKKKKRLMSKGARL